VPEVRRPGHVRAVGTVVLIVLAAMNWAAATWAVRLQSAWFDAYQAFAPRQVESMPATVVEIDEKSLAALGQWPWPRTQLAQLVIAIAHEEPAAIAVDILMPEADMLSPEQVLAHGPHQNPDLARIFRGLPSNDTELAGALAAAHAILVVAGTSEPTGMLLRAPEFSVRDSAPSSTRAASPAPKLASYAGVQTSIDVLDRAAVGRGLISAETAGGVMRRIPLVASINGTLEPALAVEMLRVALHVPSLRLLVSGASVQGIAIGRDVIPTEADGAVRVYYSRRDDRRIVSAIDVLEGKVDPARLQQKLVLIGVTGQGLLDYKNTPIGEPMPGSEIHAQLLENLYDHTLLRRPTWGPAVEAILFLVLGALLVWVTPRWQPPYAALLALGSIALLMGLAFLAFHSQRLLFDAATPGLSLMLLFSAMLGLTLAEATRQKKSLERLVQTQREQSARLAGELEAARRIQTATLPRDDVLRGERRLDLAATMIPAREVGGDLYDFFLLDERRVFFLVGDVAGKGLSASIFMAVSKALYKSTMLRTPDADIGEIMSAANAEVSRDNPEMLFVTVFAGILDLETGVLNYCNAGHENPYLLHPADGALQRIEDGDGPPLCVVADFVYHGGHYRMRPAEMLCVISDGVTEAQNLHGDFYGRPRLQDLIMLHGVAATARGVVDAVRTDVEAFVAGAEPADDFTILVLRWRGPAG
jgi:serine phosphatase RsbU (regulator of sigma subunit)/CHASE2 domain-containing sensor protein